jgi:hypothetical protein
MKRIQIVGKTFGRLMVVNCEGGDPLVYSCSCSCGNTVSVRGSLLRYGITKSCGCLQKESVGERSTIHGNAKRGEWSEEYAAWHSMNARIQARKGRNWENYGRRGIAICERWNKFENFFADMGPKPSPRHSVDRINNGGNYEPGNCRWATPSEQARNRRKRSRSRFGRFDNQVCGDKDPGAIVLEDGEIKASKTGAQS